MEDLVDLGRGPGSARGQVNANFWRGRKVLLTGHTGFIGGWTAAWLCALGSKVTGFALAPETSPCFHDLTRLSTRIGSILADIRSPAALAQAFESVRPDIVLHLAAQPLVRGGYQRPLETFDVNVVGTANLLDIVRQRGTEGVVIFTSDKVYAGGSGPHAEDSRLGGNDPYGASKACCELVAQTYARSFLDSAHVGLATVRAGNVIGGGDWSEGRIVPDAIRAFTAGRRLLLRHPEAVRPWQHVLDAVAGMLIVAQEAIRLRRSIGAWNIGPSADTITVGTLADMVAREWGGGAVARISAVDFPETQFLAIDSSRAKRELGIASAWDTHKVVAQTVSWYKRANKEEDAWSLTRSQIETYEAECTAAAEQM